MAKGKKTGGRNFKKGQGGRKKGAKDKVPRSFKRNVEEFFREVHTAHPELLFGAVTRGLKASPSVAIRFVELWLNFVHGKPPQTINIGPDLSGLSDEELRAWEQLMQKAHAGAKPR